jgi:hypothetical protein
MEEAACIYEAEPPFDPFNPFVAPVEFPRVEITAPGQTVVLPEARLPTYLSAPVDSIANTLVQVTVTEDSVLYMYDPEHITNAVNATSNLPVTLPTPIANTHCPDSEVQRFDLGAAWGPGTYNLTVSYPDGDGVIEELDLTTAYLLWMHFTSVPTWTSSPG